MPTIEENISRFEQLLSSVQRDGIDKLMRYIKKNTDFYKAPASTRFHLACEGGLLQHSLNVYDCLTAKLESPIWKDVLKDIPAESFILIALLHDLCKANTYVEGTKNQKTYDPEKVAAARSSGIWRQRPSDGMLSGGRSPGTAAVTMTEDAKTEENTAGAPAVHT